MDIKGRYTYFTQYIISRDLLSKPCTSSSDFPAGTFTANQWVQKRRTKIKSNSKKVITLSESKNACVENISNQTVRKQNLWISKKCYACWQCKHRHAPDLWTNIYKVLITQGLTSTPAFSIKSDSKASQFQIP